MDKEKALNKLNEYIKGKINLSPIINLIYNNNLFEDIGEYIIDNVNIDNYPEFNYIKKSKLPNSDLLSNYTIIFTTGILNDKTLKNMFGDPIYHNEFGEGFEGEWDEDINDYNEPDNKFLYASYFLNINNQWVHIGYDHRGTRIELETPYNTYNPNISIEYYNKCVNTLKEIINIFNKNN